MRRAQAGGEGRRRTHDADVLEGGEAVEEDLPLLAGGGRGRGPFDVAEAGEEAREVPEAPQVGGERGGELVAREEELDRLRRRLWWRCGPAKAGGGLAVVGSKRRGK